MWPETEEKIEIELAQLGRLVETHRELIDKVTHSAPAPFELSALSAYLHSFYTGVENIFKQIAADVDGQRVTSGRWHSDLLKAMARPTVARAAVISDDLLERLSRYMGFRHVFRHAYTFELDWGKMQDLVRESECTLAEVAAACRSLFADKHT